MVRAFIMVKTDAGSSPSVIAAIGDLDGVREAHVVAGEFDIIVEAETAEIYDVLHDVATGIRGIDGVADTRTYIGLG